MHDSQTFIDLEVDGVDVIDIGPWGKTPLKAMLSYYDPTPKQLPTGKGFTMYAGLYYYLITVGDNTRFLRAETLDDLDVKRKYDWANVPSLERQLARALEYNLHRSPLAIPFLVHQNLPIVWCERRQLRNAERRWLRVVQRVVEKLRQSYQKK